MREAVNIAFCLLFMWMARTHELDGHNGSALIYILTAILGMAWPDRNKANQ